MKKFLRVLNILLFILIVAVVGATFFRSHPPLPVYGTVPDFQLTERSGKAVTHQDLRGKVWIADIIFTRCAGVCPMMSGKMMKLTKKLPEVFFVSFTTDPDYDSPQVLSTYADWYQADPERWLFLTGPKEMLSAVTTGFKMNKIDEPEMHSERFVLVDKEWKLRGFYDSNDDAAMEKLIKDARILC